VDAIGKLKRIRNREKEIGKEGERKEGKENGKD
jgi:hypothetical protein